MFLNDIKADCLWKEATNSTAAYVDSFSVISNEQFFLFLYGEENTVLSKNKYKYLISVVLVITTSVKHPQWEGK